MVNYRGGGVDAAKPFVRLFSVFGLA